MNRIVTLRLISFAAGRFLKPALVNKTKGVLRHLHVGKNYFGDHCRTERLPPVQSSIA